MITIEDLYNIVGNKISNEAQKALIRNSFPHDIAELMIIWMGYRYMSIVFTRRCIGRR